MNKQTISKLLAASVFSIFAMGCSETHQAPVGEKAKTLEQGAEAEKAFKILGIPNSIRKDKGGWEIWSYGNYEKKVVVHTQSPKIWVVSDINPEEMDNGKTMTVWIDGDKKIDDISWESETAEKKQK